MMKHRLIRRLLLSAVVAIVAIGAAGLNLEGYTAGQYKWHTETVPYYVNPKNKWVSEAAALSALQMAADGWSQQSQANVQLAYAGYTSGSSLTMNNKNEVFFRDTSNGSYIAETYYWWDGQGRLVDADIVFYEGKFSFFAFSGCSNGIYIESVGIHEFGHALGLLHSSVQGATMYSTMPSYCDLTQMTLDSDDIAGIEAMYPPVSKEKVPLAPTELSVAASGSSPTSSLVLSWKDNASDETGFRIERSTDGSSFAQIAQVGANVKSYTAGSLASGTTYYFRVRAYNGVGASGYSNTAAGQTQADAPVNTAPVLTTTNPGDGASYPDNVAITFSGSASDTQDGDLTSKMTWTSSVSGSLGTGGSFSRTLPAGTHVITAQVTDSGGLNASKTVTMTVTASAPSGPGTPADATLTVSKYMVNGQWRAKLVWSGLTSEYLSVRRDGTQLRKLSKYATEWVDSSKNKRSSHTYQVCEFGTSICTNTVTVVFY